MLPKEDRIKKMFEFLQKYYSNVFGKVFVSESVFFDRNFRREPPGRPRRYLHEDGFTWF